MTELRVADVMTCDVYAVSADTSLETAARLLTARGISGAPVVSRTGRPVGVVSLADLADPDRPRSAREGYPLYYHVESGLAVERGDDLAIGEGRVGDVMSPFVLSVPASAPIGHAARVLLNDRVHRLLVIADEQLVGIVTAIDLLRGFVGAVASGASVAAGSSS
jgi:CBS domain-containing protein